MTEKEREREKKLKEGYICFDDTPEDFSDYIKYLKEQREKKKNSTNN